jgi:hypothetical protein
MLRTRSPWLLLSIGLTLASPVLLSVVAPSEALAQSPDEVKIARQTAMEGLTAYKESQFEKAVNLFEQAKAVYPSGQILRMLGYSLLGLERWEEALKAMEDSLETDVGPLTDKDKDDVREQMKKALAHFGTVNISSSVAGAELVVDGSQAYPLPLEKPLRLVEGKHTLVVKAKDHDDARHELDVRGGRNTDLALDPKSHEKEPPVEAKPEPTPEPPPPPKKDKDWLPHQKLIGFSAIGVGVLSGGAALTSFLMSSNLKGNVEDDVAAHNASFGANCDKGDYRLCVYDRALINDDADQADSLQTVSLATAIGAGAFIAGGVVLVVFSGDDDGADKGQASGPKSAQAACGPFGAGLLCSGTF